MDGETWEETSLSTNGGFEIPNYDEGLPDYCSEWTINISGDDASGYGYETKIDEYNSNNTSRIFNIYNNSTTQTASFSMSRTLEDVPAGTYKLRFEQGDSGNIRSQHLCGRKKFAASGHRRMGCMGDCGN